MKLYDVGVNNKGTTLILWVCDDDEKNMKEYRGSLKAVLQHIFSDLVLNDWNKVKYQQYDHKNEQRLVKVKSPLTKEDRKPA